MNYLYGLTPKGEPKLVATFDSDVQLRVYVTWATLKTFEDDTRKFEQGSALANFKRYTSSTTPLTSDDPETVFHNPSPAML
jgi:hypothetical protein